MKFIIQSLIAFWLLLFAWTANADMLEKIKIEDAIRLRVEQTLRVFDPAVQIQASFQYRSFQESLPGTSFTEGETFAPSKIEASDILRINLKVFSKLPGITDEMKAEVYNQIPIEKYKINLQYVAVKAADEKPVPIPVQPQDLHEIVDRTILSLTKILAGLVAISLTLLLGSSLYQTRKKLSAMKEQMGQLSTAVTENGGGSGYVGAATANSGLGVSGSSGSAGSLGGSLNMSQSSLLENFPIASLREILADCYWSQEDGYAHWLWKNTTYQQKLELLQQVGFMSAYAVHFVQSAEIEKTFHNHPYYLNPFELYKISQDDLAAILKKTPSLFHHISALRQLHLPFSFAEKMKIVNAPAASRPNWTTDKQSIFRQLAPQVQWGDLSNDDEAVLFQNSEMVPRHLQNGIRTLAWLAQREETYIRKTLEKYDARSLATVWVGSDDVLKKLESMLPEKKLKNLHAHLSKIAPSKNLALYQALVDEGLRRDDAA